MNNSRIGAGSDLLESEASRFNGEVFLNEESLGSGQFCLSPAKIVFIPTSGQPIWFAFTSIVMHAIAADDAGRRYLFIQLDEDDEDSEEETIFKIYFNDQLDEIFSKMNELSVAGDEEFEEMEDGMDISANSKPQSCDLEYIESEIANLGLLIDHGVPAWEVDNCNAQILLEQASKELNSLQAERDELMRNNNVELFEKELQLVETDLFNYIRNNEKTLLGLKKIEQQAKQKYRKGQSEKLDKLADSLFT